MAVNKKTKEERQAKKQKRRENRQLILAILAGLKNKNIKTMTAKEKEDVLIVVCDLLGISENGIVK